MSAQHAPVDPDDITPAWLTDVLRQSGVIDASTVTDVQSESMAVGVGFAGSLARLTVSYDRPNGSGPNTVVAKYASVHGPTKELANGLGLYEREVRFYRELAAKSSMRTPRCYFGNFVPDDGAFLLLLEDLSHMRTRDQLEGCSLDDAESVAKELARLHAQHWNSDHSPNLKWLPSFEAVADWAQRAFPRAWAAFQERASDIIPDSLASAARLVTPRMGSVIRRLSEPPVTVKHGDVRLDNLFFPPSGSDCRLAAIDWQLIGLLRGTYDLAYFVAMSLTSEMRRRHLDQILDLYHRTLTDLGVTGYSLDDCREDYGYTLLYLPFFMAVAGSTLEMESTRGQMLARAMTGRLAAAVADLEAPALLQKLG